MELKKLGIYGCEAVQDLFAAAILTGDPALLIGSAGCAKTYVIQRMAETLGLNFRMYNCSSVCFEDVYGFPIPDSSKTHMEYISLPSSIWGTEMLLLDECNRCSPMVMNSFYTLIRNRSVQGKQIESLKVIFAAMNPLSYAGTAPLDTALADRFAWTIHMPSFPIIGEEDRCKIISNVTPDDSPALSHWGGIKHTHTDETIRKDLTLWFKKAASIYESYLSDCKDVVAYVDDITCSISQSARNKSGPIEGRRAGIILRNILSLAAVREAYGLSGGLEAAAGKAIFHSFPNEAVDEAIPNEVLQVAHEKAKHHLRASVSSIIEKIERMSDPLLKVAYGIRHSIEPVVLGGYVMQYLDDHRHDPAALIAFAYAAWPYLKYSNITSDALTQVSKLISSVCGSGRNERLMSSIDFDSGWWEVSDEFNNINTAEKNRADTVQASFVNNVDESVVRSIITDSGQDWYEFSSRESWQRTSVNHFTDKILLMFEHMAYIMSDGLKFKPKDLLEKQ